MRDEIHGNKLDFEPQENLIYGKNAVTELLKSGENIDTLYLAEGLNSSLAGYYTALAKEAGAVVKRVHSQKLKAMCGTEHHQGVACYAATVLYQELSELLALSRESGRTPFFVLADGIEDPHNLGALMRSALLFGAHGLIIPRRGGVGVTPVVHKASAGASMHLPIARVANIATAVRQLKENNIFVYCADMGGETAFRQNLTGSIALVVGSEGKGVSALVKSLCDGAVRIPMAADITTGIDSLNASVAAGVVMYEILRQRMEEKKA